MKKLLIFAIVMLLASSCTCLIAQIPPQYIYVTTNCEATLPDYLPMVTVSDNCQIKSVTQNPLPGFTLNATNPQVTVTIRATDVFDNFTEISFSVKAVDTVPPTIIPTGDLLTDNWQKIHGLYDAADRLLAETGVRLARRTIAQYREAEGIPPAYRRKKRGETGA